MAFSVFVSERLSIAENLVRYKFSSQHKNITRYSMWCRKHFTTKKQQKLCKKLQRLYKPKCLMTIQLNRKSNVHNNVTYVQHFNQQSISRRL